MYLVAHSLHADVHFLHSYAVVIGIDTYSSSKWEQLGYAKKDAKAVAELLKKENHQVTELYDSNATKHNILAALDDLSDKLKADDRVVIFIASHGTIKTVGAAKFGYIVPYDGVDFASYVSDLIWLPRQKKCRLREPRFSSLTSATADSW
jgi:hypothetical protein